MATTIFFNGRVTAQPGSYSKVDATALAVVGLSAVGIVALLGEVEGGSPYNGDTPVHRITSPGQVGRTFREGDLVEAAAIAFDPAKDPDIPGGAVEVIAVKVNPATQSSVTLNDDSAVAALTVTSVDYGLFTTQINLDVSAGTTIGKAVTVVLGDTTEVFDNIGGNNVWTAQFTQGTNTLSTVTVTLDNTSGVTGSWTRADAGLDGDISNPSLNEVARIVSSDVGDTTQTATIYGISDGDPATEVIALNGTTPVLGTTVWDAGGILGVILSAVTTGNITIDNSPTTGTTVISITAGSTNEGVVLVDNASVFPGSVLTVTPSSGPGGARDIAIFGLAGQDPKGEVITVNSPAAVAGSDTDWTEVTVIALGDADAAITWTVSANAFALGIVGYPTISDVVNYIADLPGWAASVSGIPGLSVGTLEIADLDELGPVDAIAPSILATFYGDLALIIQTLNNESSLVNATREATGVAPPANTSSPIYLTGGVEGTTAFADWQAALDLLREYDVSTVVPLTDDAAVHAAALAHAVYMDGRKERDVVVGGSSGIVKTAATTAVVALNSRHTRYCFQDLVRYNTSGVQETFPPYFMAAAVAGAQAGSPVGESLTFKYFNALDVEADSSFVLEDQHEELIQSGLWYLEPVQGVGFRNKRNITTHLIDNNLAFIEGSVNEAVNFTVKNVRTNLEAVVAKKGFQRTVNQAVSNVVDTLAQLIDEEVIVNWRNLTITLTDDVMEVDVEIAPVIPVNFVKTTLHLVSASFAAAA